MNLRVEGVCIRLGEFNLRDISWEVRSGEYCCLLGPTGAGKSVLIECVAGLHQPDRGRIFVGDREVTHLRPEHRAIGYVPQDYALFPNMTVRANIGFGLRIRRVPPAEIEKRVRELTDLLGITHLLDRHPLNLSGGEKQRAALARALIVRPQVLLLDEPLAAVDEVTRERLCRELRDIQRRAGVTVVHISHSFEETLAVADRIGIMAKGEVIQVGTPDEIFASPKNRFVAEFTRSGNLLPIQGPPEPLGDDLARVTLAGGETLVAAYAHPKDAPSLAIVRPESVRVFPFAAGGGSVTDGAAVSLPGVLTEVSHRGHVAHLQARTDGGVTLAVLMLRGDARTLGLQEGDRVDLRVHAEDVHLL